MTKTRLWKILLYIGAIFALVWPFNPTFAQDNQPSAQTYTVQEGDTLSGIAEYFGLSVSDLAAANGITDYNAVNVGDQLIIPGRVPFGETLRSLSRRYAVSAATLANLNHLTSPQQIYAGMLLILPPQDSSTYGRRVVLAPGQSLMELGVLQNTTTWTLVNTNELNGSWAALPGDILRAPGADDPGPGALPAAISEVTVNKLFLKQGHTATVRVTSVDTLVLSGSLTNYSLHFFKDGENSYVALQGINSKTIPGMHLLTIRGSLPDGTSFGFSQRVLVQAEEYLWEDVNCVPQETLDPTVTQPEDEKWAALAAPVTPERLWSGMFESPLPLIGPACPTIDLLNYSVCWVSLFGSRRAYNGGPRDYYHTGLDMYAQPGTEIHASAPGTVVFVGNLDVRGGATMIDHGWGVYTAYLHQSEFMVQPGDSVTAGQLIGLTGGTGRVCGPHLHWEILVGGVPVDPLDWLQQAFP
jgi:murein DD-endopeptidase MepM/ murein hydrolase activator NlpD